MRWIVSGTDRAVGAIGISQHWTEELEADTEADAYHAARELRYGKGREHVHVLKCHEEGR